MHIIFREARGLEDTEVATDLGQSPAPLVVLSFSDSDLGAFAAGWQGARDDLPALRLANLAALKHPLSVDTYIEQTLSGAKGVLVRLIGGVSYWSYGLTQLHDLARRQGIALAVLPADGRQDPALDALSTLPHATLRRLATLCDAGGAVAARAALAQLALAAGLYAAPVPGLKSVPESGWYLPGTGVVAAPPAGDAPLAVVSFYRAYLTSGDTAPIDAFIAALTARGLRAAGLFAPRSKRPAPPHGSPPRWPNTPPPPSSTPPPFPVAMIAASRRSMRPAARCSRSPYPPPASPIGRKPHAASRPPTLRCMSCCPKSTGGFSQA